MKKCKQQMICSTEEMIKEWQVEFAAAPDLQILSSGQQSIQSDILSKRFVKDANFFTFKRGASISRSCIGHVPPSTP